MLSVPTVPVAPDASTEIPLKAPVLPLVNVRFPVNPFCPTDSAPPLIDEPLPSTVTAPFPPDVPMNVPALLESMWPRDETEVVLPLPSVSVEVVESVEPAPVMLMMELLGAT